MTDPFGVLRRVMQPRERRTPGEVCEMCGEPVAGEHGHVADLGERRLMCTCRPCYLLFTQDGAAGRRLRAVPDRYLSVADFAISQGDWDELAIPVDLVFFLRQSDAKDAAAGAQVVAVYPGPGGATESELDLAAWLRIAAANPALAEVQTDVEAVLVRRLPDGAFRCFIVPIDACYRLVGLVRQHWTGFAGGTDVWQRIEAFFGELQDRAPTRVG